MISIRPFSRSGALLLVGVSGILGCNTGSHDPQIASEESRVAPGEPEAAEVDAPVRLRLPSAPKEALAALRQASKDGPVLVFKHSPICPISAAAQERFHTWLDGVEPEARVRYAHIDVLAQKPLARGLVAELGIRHESPQALLFVEGELAWHDSHGAITSEAIDAHLSGNK